uniref:Pept_C1 domain-containing protein n=1 Tax=Steinernema glaseri TaxID=37863 RepID=A0A1I7YB33_9BILA
MPEYQHYRAGVISSPYCGNKSTNHAVLAVGYGEENGLKYWLIKNSYGHGWGQHGYFKIERGVNMCGVGTFANYPVLN